MRLQFVNLFIALALTAILSCKKERIAPETNSSDSIELAMQNLSTQEEKNFFDLRYLEEKNSFLIPEIEERNGDDSLVNSVFHYLLLLNHEQPFASQLVNNFGYPAWSRSLILEDVNNAGSIVLTPFAKTNENFIRGFTIAIPSLREGEWYPTMRERFGVDSLLGLPTYDSTTNTGFYILETYKFDLNLFNNASPNYGDWINNNIPRTNGEGFSRTDDTESREWVTSIVTFDCNPCPIALAPEILEERNGCTICLPYISAVDDGDCGVGGGGTGGGVGAGFGFGFGNGFGTPSGGQGGSGVGVGGGAGNNSSNDETIVNDYETDICQWYQSYSPEGGGEVTEEQLPGEYDPLQDAKCEAFHALLSGLGFASASELTWLIVENSDVMLELGNWIKGHGELTAIEQEAMVKYIQMKQNETTELDWKRFLNLYKLVVTELQPLLGLSLPEVDHLLSQAGFTNQIDDFLTQHPNNELAEAFVNFNIDETSDASVWGNIDIGSLNLLNEFDATLSYLAEETEAPPAEIQNGIDILEINTLEVQPQPPYGNLFGGSENNSNGGGDLDFHTHGDLNLLTTINQNVANSPTFLLEHRMKNMFFLATVGNGAGEAVSDDYLQQFHENEAVFHHYSQMLSAMVSNTINMRNWLREYGNQLNDKLEAANGDINDIIPPKGLGRVTLNENHSLTILINDTQKITVYALDTYNFDPQTGKWDCQFLVNVTDNFGLDEEDVVDFQNHFPFGASFISWWSLQFRHAWAPFITDVWFVAHLGGEF